MNAAHLKKVHGKENPNWHQGPEVIWSADVPCYGGHSHEIWNDQNLRKKQPGVFQGLRIVTWSALTHAGLFSGYCCMSHGHASGHYYSCHYHLHWSAGYCVHSASQKIVSETEKCWVQVLQESICYSDESLHVSVQKNLGLLCRLLSLVPQAWELQQALVSICLLCNPSSHRSFQAYSEYDLTAYLLCW